MPKLIAEIGVNHEGSIERAIDMVTDASLAGIDAVKFQTYKASELTTEDAISYWDTRKEKETSQYDLFKRYETHQLEWYKQVFNHCQNLGIEFMTTLFSVSLVETFAPLLSNFKISSSDLTNRRLIYEIIKYKKPLYISTGASSLNEIESLLSFIKECSPDHKITLMHCVLNYPCKAQDANLGFLKTLKSHFPEHEVGYSCHVPGDEGIECCRLASTLGATVIEKHFSPCTLRNGNDHYHALDAKQFSSLRNLLAQDKILIGNDYPDLKIQNDARLNARRGLYYAKPIKKGNSISDHDIVALRPLNKAIPADKYFDIIGMVLKKDVEPGSPASFTDFLS